MKSYTFGTPEGLEIIVDLVEQFAEDGYTVRGWEITVDPAPGFAFGRPAAALRSNGEVNIELSSDHELERDDRF